MSKELPKLFSIPVKTIQGKDTTLVEHFGKTILFVNVASRCGYTKQYDGLEKLYKEFKDNNFVILGFPSNDFMSQEPGTNQEIAEFCKLKYGVSFPLYEKKSVKGKDIQPVYKELLANSIAISDADISWNFEKILVGRNGKVIARYKPAVEPQDEQLIAAIKKDAQSNSK